MSALWLWVGLAFADCDPATAAAEVRAEGKKAAYDCLIERTDGADVLVTALAETPTDGRLSRALALWMLHRADTPFDPAQVALLNGDDKRLLGDGVRARRGRKSPVPAHHAVFEQFAWYQPVATYTDGRLRPGDKEQIARLNTRESRSSVVEPDAPEADGVGRLRAWFEANGLSTILPAAVALVGVLGAVAWVRKPKTA